MWIVVAIVVLAALCFLVWRLNPSKTRQHDKLAEHDAETAARTEMQRAETNMRGRGAGGMGGGTGF